MIVALVFDAVVFFFQAEDGIRDGHVTGVQTCALPICGVFAVMFIYPFFEAWLLKDKREHHILDRPRNNPTRTAIGVAGVIFYCNMWAAASGDIVAVFFQMSLNDMIYIFRAVFFLGPIIGYIITKRMCIALQRKDREIALHGRETAHIIRLPHGEFLERHEAQ